MLGIVKPYAAEPAEGCSGGPVASRDAAPRLDIASDGSVWLPSDQGLAHFDGETWDWYLEGRPVEDIDIAPDGTVWVQANDLDMGPGVAYWEQEGTTSTYVVTPDAVAAASEQESSLMDAESPTKTYLAAVPQRARLPDDGTWRATTRKADDRFAHWASSDLTDWQRVVGGKIKLGDHLVKLTARQLLIEGDDHQPELELDITPFRKRQTLPAMADGDVNCGGGSSGTAELGAGVLAHTRTTDCRSTDIWMIEFERFAH